MLMIAQRAGCRISDFGLRISDVGCWISDFGFRMSVGWDVGPGWRHLGCANYIASRAAGPERRMSDFGFRLAGMPVLGGDTLAARIVLRRGRPGLTGGTRRTFRRGCSGRR